MLNGEGRLPASQIVAAVRRPESVADLAALGVQVRQADYTQPASLDVAFRSAEKVLLISSSEVGQRTVQHRNVIDAAALLGAGMPEPLAALLADSDRGAAAGALFDDQRQLGTLIGRPTTPLADMIAATLRG